MMEETGIIVEIKVPGIATVLCRRGSMCDHCASADACRLGNDKESMLVDAMNPLGAEVGQRVKVAVSTKGFLKSSFLLYIVPLIALVIGGALGQVLGNRLVTGPDPNLLAALLGSSFLVVSLLLIKFAARALSKESYMPQIIAIIEEEE